MFPKAKQKKATTLKHEKYIYKNRVIRCDHIACKSFKFIQNMCVLFWMNLRALYCTLFIHLIVYSIFSSKYVCTVHSSNIVIYCEIIHKNQFDVQFIHKQKYIIISYILCYVIAIIEIHAKHTVLCTHQRRFVFMAGVVTACYFWRFNYCFYFRCCCCYYCYNCWDQKIT